MSKLAFSLVILMVSLNCFSADNTIPELEFSAFFAPNDLTLEDVRMLSESHWKSLYKNEIHESNMLSNDYVSAVSDSTLWLKVDIPYNYDAPTTLIELSPNVGLFGLLAQYIDGRWRWIQPEGIGRNAEEQFPSNFLTFNLENPNGARTAYLKLNTSISYHFMVKTYSTKSFLQYSVSKHIFHGFIFGFLCLAIIYNLIIGISASERIYIAYASFVICNTFYISVISGYLRLVWPEWGSTGTMANLGAALLIASSIVFAREFLSADQYAPSLDKFLKVIQALTLANLLGFAFASESFALLSNLIVGALTPLAIIYATYKCHIHGHPYAKYCLIAWGLFMLTIGAWVSMWFGLVKPYPYVADMFKIGTLIEIIFLSIILAYRYTYLKDQTTKLSAAKETYEKLSETDELTGLCNRRGFLKHANQIVSNSRDEFIWLAIHVDHFKKFNETHGYILADKLLAEFGKLLSTNQRRDDLAALLSSGSGLGKEKKKNISGKLDGAEFAVLLSIGSVAQARLYAERILDDFRNLKVIDANGYRVGTTLSIGVTRLQKNESLEDTWRRAGKLVFQAKTSGRNKVVSDRADPKTTMPLNA